MDRALVANILTVYCYLHHSDLYFYTFLAEFILLILLYQEGEDVRETDTEYPGYLFAHAQCLFVAPTTSSFRQCFRVHELCSSNKVCLAPILD